MKNTKQLIVIAIITICITTKMNASKEINSISKKSFFTKCLNIAMPADDANLQLIAIVNESVINLHVSFNGNEGATGSMKIYNASNQMVTEVDVNLVAAPSFTIVNLNEWSPGTYSVELTTSSGTHTSHFTITQ